MLLSWMGTQTCGTLQRAVVFSHGNLSSPESEKLQMLLPFVCCVPWDCLLYATGWWISVVNECGESKIQFYTSSFRTNVCQGRLRDWRVKSLQGRGDGRWQCSLRQVSLG